MKKICFALAIGAVAITSSSDSWAGWKKGGDCTQGSGTPVQGQESASYVNTLTGQCVFGYIPEEDQVKLPIFHDLAFGKVGGFTPGN